MYKEQSNFKIKVKKSKMATMPLFTNLFENCNNMISVESDEGHFSANRISISFFITELVNFKI